MTFSFSRLEKLPSGPAGGVTMAHGSFYRRQFDMEAEVTQRSVTHTYTHVSVNGCPFLLTKSYL